MAFSKGHATGFGIGDAFFAAFRGCRVKSCEVELEESANAGRLGLEKTALFRIENRFRQFQDRN
jgi:hypothetical protein